MTDQIKDEDKNDVRKFMARAVQENDQRRLEIEEIYQKLDQTGHMTEDNASSVVILGEEVNQMRTEVQSIQSSVSEILKLLRTTCGAADTADGSGASSQESKNIATPNVRQSRNAKTPFTSANSGQYYSSIFKDKSKDSDEESEEPEEQKRKANLRRSKMFKELSLVEQVATSENVTRSQLVPACKLMLKSLDAAEFLEWFQDWKHFQQTYKTLISPTLIVSETIAARLCRVGRISTQAFHMLSPSDFFALVAEETITYHKFDHWNQVNDALRKVKKVHWSTGGRRVVPRNHEQFFDEMIDLARKVLEAHDFFRAANNENVPEIQGKYGTSAWFLNRVGKDHNEVILAMIPPIKKKNYRNLEAFVNAYMSAVESMFQQSKQLRSIPYQDDVFYQGGRAVNGNERIEAGEASGSKRTFYPVKKNGHLDSRNKSGLHNLRNGERDSSSDASSGSESSSDSSDEETPAREANPSVTWTDREVEAQPNRVPRQEGADLEDYPEFDTTHLDRETLAALDIQAASKELAKQDRFDGCIYYTIFGKCVKGRDCKHASGHTAEASKQTAAWIIRRFAERDRQASGAPRKILQREQRT